MTCSFCGAESNPELTVHYEKTGEVHHCAKHFLIHGKEDSYFTKVETLPLELEQETGESND